MARGDLIDEKYKVVEQKGEGTFSIVYNCQRKKDGKRYAVKRMKQKYKSWDQVNALQEVRCLKRLNPHPNVIGLKEIVFDTNTGAMAIVCELMDINLYELIKDRSDFLQASNVKAYTYQLLQALDHMHRLNIFHRDVKPENVLVRLADNSLKLADFGSSRGYRGTLPFTEYISTRWYRAPECLLTDGHYTYSMDIWSAGCVFYEIAQLQPLFPGRNELDQINRIHSVLGTPSRAVLAKFKQSRHMSFDFKQSIGVGLAEMFRNTTPDGLDLLTRLCTYDPERRCGARTALQHPFFRELRERSRREEKKERLTQTGGSTVTRWDGGVTLPAIKQQGPPATTKHPSSSAPKYIAGTLKKQKGTKTEIPPMPSIKHRGKTLGGMPAPSLFPAAHAKPTHGPQPPHQPQYQPARDLGSGPLPPLEIHSSVVKPSKTAKGTTQPKAVKRQGGAANDPKKRNPYASGPLPPI